MNPNEEIPPEVEDRAYYNQPVWKRVVVILAGPAVNLVIAFAIVWVLFLANGQSGRLQAGRRGPGQARARDAARRRPARVGGRRRAARRTRFATRSPRTVAPAAQVDGCLAATPARIVVKRHGQLMTFELTAPIQRAGEAAAARLQFGSTQQTVGPVRRGVADRHGLWSVTKTTVSVDRADLRAAGT